MKFCPPLPVYQLNPGWVLHQWNNNPSVDDTYSSINMKGALSVEKHTDYLPLRALDLYCLLFTILSGKPVTLNLELEICGMTQYLRHEKTASEYDGNLNGFHFSWEKGELQILAILLSEQHMVIFGQFYY